MNLAPWKTALSCFVFIGVLSSIGLNGFSLADDLESVVEEVPAEVKAGPRALSKAFRMAARKASPSVVTILTYGQEPKGLPQTSSRGKEGDDSDAEVYDEKRLTGLGSGVIVSDDGMVITNNHVIAGAKRVVVQLPDETELEATEVYGDRDSDVATLRIVVDPSQESMRDVTLVGADVGDSDAIEIGDWVLAIGSPFRLEATVSAGIISAKNRAISRINRGRLIQTDAAINPGNSGGPLIDLDGNVVAINTAIATRNGGYQGIGFAIPINQAKWIAEELAQHGKVRRAAIGIRMAELKPKIARKFKLPSGIGILAYQIIGNSAAQRAGIKPLDVIVEFAGERVTKPANLQLIVERKPIGSLQTVKVLRGNEEIELEIEIASLEDPTLSNDSATEGEAESASQSSESDEDSEADLPMLDEVEEAKKAMEESKDD
ncbi:Periplasmic serine endoprotease DegP precursor [Rubripirellula amarantea]|uniref:Periplasmic serine endoprotease DegP n=1 Tax=Rubripirellula amarantea TaxID=2527999 RepID=A0A5C5WU35_9BACT|nr:trypsin-like peptidase domain-containing protein [Rubripirellula amarantea]TWT54088.1 Periplasmic serine endoprotease DegP precursor [Rubripirellula amarantea]